MGARKRSTGLDWLDIAIHLGATAMVAVLAVSMVKPEDPTLAAVFGGSLALLGWRRSRARAAAVPEPSPGEATAELEARLAELEVLQHRVTELEERVDFAERLLAKRAEPLGLPDRS